MDSWGKPSYIKRVARKEHTMNYTEENNRMLGTADMSEFEYEDMYCIGGQCRYTDFADFDAQFENDEPLLEQDDAVESLSDITMDASGFISYPGYEDQIKAFFGEF